jgi:hypothetical protein
MILAVRFPPAVPILATPVILALARSLVNPPVVTTNAAEGPEPSEVDPEIPNHPVLSQNELGPKKAKALPKAMTIPQN